MLSDIHGNYAAFSAVMEAFNAKKVEKIICLGDLVGYFHQSLAVLDEVINLNIPTLLGNHEAYLLGRLACSKEKWDFISLGYVKKALTDRQRTWLEGLPLSRELGTEQIKMAFFHASPWNPLEEYIYPDHKDFDRFGSLDWDYIFLGHTHYPLIKQIGRCTVINPGSCGEPRQGDHRACAVIFDTGNKTLEPLLVEYDVKGFILGARQFGIPEKVINVLERSLI